MKNKKWYKPGRRLGWKKDETTTARRREALKSRRGDMLKTARALGALANITQDKDTAQKARADARFFYRLYKENK